MDAARKKAMDTLLADDLSRQIFLHFSSAMPMGNSETFADVENSPRFKNPHPEAWAAFQQHRQQYIDLLKDAIEGWDMRTPSTSILDSAASEAGKTFVLFTNDFESIPKEYRDSARSLGEGRYRIEGPHALAVAMGAVKAGEPGEKKSAPDASKFEISREVVAQDFSKYRELHELAEKEGKLVTVVD